MWFFKVTSCNSFGLLPIENVFKAVGLFGAPLACGKEPSTVFPAYRGSVHGGAVILQPQAAGGRGLSSGLLSGPRGWQGLLSRGHGGLSAEEALQNQILPH